MAPRIIETLLVGFALAAGVWLFDELRTPYSNLRLHLDSALDRIREGVRP